MAFVSDEHELIFVHIPKNGGTAICDALARLHGKELIQNKPYIHNGVGNGVPPSHRPNGIEVHDTQAEIFEKYPQAKGYTSFAVIRNPWARIYSFYKHKLRRGDRDLPDGSFAQVMRKSNVLLLQPQLWWICHGCEYYALRFENLENDYHDMMGYLGIKAPDLNRLNTDIAPDDYRKHYDEYSRSLIAEYYRYEIEVFGYEF